tara:strand:- start:5570 stop:5788 length:219 start_codon:yes stop_codon:yes gene_type:complete
MSTEYDDNQKRYIGAGISIGVAVGIALGLVIGNIAIGIGPGIAIGVAIGILLAKRHSPHRNEKKQAPDSGNT